MPGEDRGIRQLVDVVASGMRLCKETQDIARPGHRSPGLRTCQVRQPFAGAGQALLAHGQRNPVAARSR